jgi:hypothetical protein
MSEIILPEVNCSTAEEFLQALSPIGEYFKDQELDAPWLFRGQGKDYPLIPSLFRKNGKIKSLTRRNVGNFAELLKAERDVLINFFQIADRQGLMLPDDSQELRSYLELLSSNDDAVGEGFWKIEHKALSLMALAQHYGVPTRLLDWTRQSYIAAFFAGEDAYKYGNSEEEKTDFLVVWAFHFPILGKIGMYSPDSYFIRGITAPSATNANLKAQQGIFTLANPNYTEEISGTYLPLDVILKRFFEKHPDTWMGKCKLRKFLLPTCEGLQLLHLLAKLNITPSSIYPGYQSIVSDLQMQNRWD